MDTNKIFIENLKNVKKNTKKLKTINSKFMNKLQRWSYSKVIFKLKTLCEEQGIILEKVSPEYTSQKCSACGFVDKNSRNLENFICTNCGFKIDADYNASINILHRGVYNPSTTQNSFY